MLIFFQSSITFCNRSWQVIKHARGF